jgi:hypothetical protein
MDNSWFKAPTLTPLEEQARTLMDQMSTTFWLACPTRLACIPDRFSAFETDAVWLCL